MTFGFDRYKRRYWVLPHSGGILVEGMESAIPEDFAAEASSASTETNSEEAKEHITDTKENIVKTENQDSTVPSETAIKQELHDEVKEESDRTLDDNKCAVKMEENMEQALDFSTKKDVSDMDQALDLSDKRESRHEETRKVVERSDGEQMEVSTEAKVQNEEAEESKDNLFLQKPEDLSSFGMFQTNVKKEEFYSEDTLQESHIIARDLVNDVIDYALKDVGKKVDHSLMNGECGKEVEDGRASTSEKSLDEKADLKPGFVNLDGMVPRSETKSPLIKPYNGGEIITADQLSKLPGSKLNGVTDSTNAWFSILPRLPCDENSLTKLETPSSTDSTSKADTDTSQSITDHSQVSADAAAAAAFPAAFAFNPYIYHVPIPFMPVGQMNSFLGAYAAFPQMAAIPMQPVGPSLNGPTIDEQPMALDHILAQQLIKQEKSQETEDEEEENKAIAQMKAILAHMEAAKIEPIPSSELCFFNLLCFIAFLLKFVAATFSSIM